MIRAAYVFALIAAMGFLLRFAPSSNWHPIMDAAWILLVAASCAAVAVEGRRK